MSAVSVHESSICRTSLSCPDWKGIDAEKLKKAAAPSNDVELPGLNLSVTGEITACFATREA